MFLEPVLKGARVQLKIPTPLSTIYLDTNEDLYSPVKCKAPERLTSNKTIWFIEGI